MQAVILALTILSGVFGLYFCLIAVLGALRRIPLSSACAPNNRIAAVIPARNEQAVIAQLIKSLLAQRYPRTLFDVYVVPNNCTDETAAVARQAGAIVLPCTIPVKSKGEVLHFAFEQLLKSDYDAFAVFDADNIVDSEFFQAINNALEAGVQIAQGYRDSKNADDSWIAGCVSIFYWGMNRLYHRARHALHLSAALNGTGFMVSARLLREIGWNTRTLTEDLEFSAQCAIHGVSVGWMQDAITYDEQPVKFLDSYVQRRRWSAGTMQCMKMYLGSLLRGLFRKGGMHCADMAILFTGTLMQLICLIPVALLLIGLVMDALQDPGMWGRVWYFSAIGLLNGVGTSMALAFIICALERKLSFKRLGAIIGFPIFIMTWIPANLICLFTKPPKWKQIRHSSVVADLPDRRNLPM